MTTVFLSYAHEDQNVATRLASLLHAQGFEVVSPAVVPAGANISVALLDAIERADAFVFVISRHARAGMALEVGAVMSRLASGDTERVIPVLIDPDVPASSLMGLLSRYQALDLRGGVTEASIGPLVRP